MANFTDLNLTSNSRYKKNHVLKLILRGGKYTCCKYILYISHIYNMFYTHTHTNTHSDSALPCDVLKSELKVVFLDCFSYSHIYKMNHFRNYIKNEYSLLE